MARRGGGARWTTKPTLQRQQPRRTLRRVRPRELQSIVSSTKTLSQPRATLDCRAFCFRGAWNSPRLRLLWSRDGERLGEWCLAAPPLSSPPSAAAALASPQPRKRTRSSVSPAPLPPRPFAPCALSAARSARLPAQIEQFTCGVARKEASLPLEWQTCRFSNPSEKSADFSFARRRRRLSSLPPAEGGHGTKLPRR